MGQREGRQQPLRLISEDAALSRLPVPRHAGPAMLGPTIELD